MPITCNLVETEIGGAGLGAGVNHCTVVCHSRLQQPYDILYEMQVFLHLAHLVDHALHVVPVNTVHACLSIGEHGVVPTPCTLPLRPLKWWTALLRVLQQRPLTTFRRFLGKVLVHLGGWVICHVPQGIQLHMDY